MTMNMIDVIQLTQKLIAFRTVNPPGNEYEAVKFIGDLLTENEFKVDYVPFEKDRLHIIAEKGYSEKIPPVVFSGHLDTVPLGVKEWTLNPFGGEVKDRKLYGRGSSDMKGGVAAMVIAAIQAFADDPPEGSVRLILTSGEELGCRGAIDLISKYKDFGPAKGLIVGEPTSNIPGVGHKGGLFLNVRTSGSTAHSSMPELGDNAIYKVARAISKIENIELSAEKDPLLGFPTINVGRVWGGLNVNSVPDSAGFTIDARTTSNINHRYLLHQFKKELGDEISIEILTDLPAVSSDEDDPFVQNVYRACGIASGADGFPRTLPYLTDGSVLQKALNNVPTIILGPGEAEMAHQTDEFCYIEKLEHAVEMYQNIMRSYHE